MTIIVLLTRVCSQTKVVLDDQHNEYDLTSCLEVLEDKDRIWTIQDMFSEKVSRQFTPSNTRTLNPGITTSVWWARFQVDDAAIRNHDWVLMIKYPVMDRVDLFSTDSSGHVFLRHGGAIIPYNQRGIKNRYTVFRLDYPNMCCRTFYVRFESRSTVVLNMKLESFERFVETDHDSQFYIGGLYGSLLILLIYNLFLFLALRDTTYMFYVLYVAGYVIHQFAIDGLFQEYVFPDSSVSSVLILQIAIGCFLLFGSIFTQRVLFSKRFTPLLHKGLTLCAAASSVPIILAMAVPGPIVNYLFLVLVVPYALISIATGIISLREGYLPAGYFLLAVTGFLVGLLIRSLRVSGYLPLNYFTEYSLQIGMVWEMTLLSFALGDRINTLKDEQKRDKFELRGRIAADLHDEIGSNLSSISMTSQMIQKNPNLSQREKARLADIVNTAKETTDAIRDIVWFINPEHRTSGDLIDRMRDVAAKLLVGLEYNVKTSSSKMKGPVDLLVWKEIYLFYKEALNNIVKHAEAKHVDIEIESASRRFVLTIHDDGVGFEIATMEHGFGLNSLKARAKKLGAKITMESRPGQGTTVRLVVPIRGTLTVFSPKERSENNSIAEREK